jgi:hypothetical protein
MKLAAMFFAGVLLCNCIPHLVSGLQGKPFPSPFARPSGVGDSSPIVNFLWGASNLLLGAGVLLRHPVLVGFGPDCTALLAGAAASGVFLSLHFGKVARDRKGK